MFNVIKSFLNSEKAIASGVLVLASSAMVAIGKISPTEWMAYTQTLLGIYVAGKTVQGGVAAHAGAKASTLAAQADADQARADLASLKQVIGENDAAAAAALEEKFGEEPTDPGDPPTNPGKAGKTRYSATSEG